MKQLFHLTAICLLISCLLLVPASEAGSRMPAYIHGSHPPLSGIGKDSLTAESENEDALFDSLHLDHYGLSKEAFEYAITGYQNLLEKNEIENPGIITICDFSQSSKQKRLYVIDLDKGELVMNTYVAHGKNSGGEYARRFSNNPRSHQSSLGFYLTGDTYFGEHGLSLRIIGLEKGFNDKANVRHIVVHGSKYVTEKFLNNNPFMGRSFGCPAVPAQQSSELINNIKGGSCFFIYHPDKKYLNGSKILNG